MRAYQISGWLDGVKIRRRGWNKKNYIYFNDKGWFTSNGYEFTYDLVDFKLYDWEVYKEPKEKKRYWLWNIKGNIFWYKGNNFIDDNGRTTDGELYGDNWYIKEKIKCENDYIDI